MVDISWYIYIVICGYKPRNIYVNFGVLFSYNPSSIGIRNQPHSRRSSTSERWIGVNSLAGASSWTEAAKLLIEIDWWNFLWGLIKKYDFNTHQSTTYIWCMYVCMWLAQMKHPNMTKTSNRPGSLGGRLAETRLIYPAWSVGNGNNCSNGHQKSWWLGSMTRD